MSISWAKVALMKKITENSFLTQMKTLEMNFTNKAKFLTPTNTQHQRFDQIFKFEFYMLQKVGQ
jgi:hypothetical protein